METGRLSPSSFGFEPWQFVVLQNPDIRERLRSVSWGAQKQLPTSSHFVIMLTRTKAGMVSDSDHIQGIMKHIQNAEQIGIDSCPIEGFEKDKVEDILREEGILTEDFGVSCMVAFGYRVRETREKTRRSIEQVVQWV